jgi:hypothetical protein
MNRKALTLSIGITAFVLITIGGVIAAYAQSRTAVTPEVRVEDVLNDPTVQAALREREAAYQQLIDEANQRLAEVSAPVEETIVNEYPVSVGLAVALGQGELGGGTLLRQPELVSFNGRAAYELIFDRGQVYVDATSGAILYNSGSASLFANTSGSASRHEDDDEHGGFDD